MKGQTITEKILSAKAERTVYAGDTILAKVDTVMATDGSGPLTIRFFEEMDGKKSFNAARVLMIIDHYVPCPNDKVAALHHMMQTFCAKGYGTLFEGGEGICHQLLPEKGYVYPGELIVGGDSHSTTYGALNALGTGVGSSDLAAAIIKGELWLKVPSSIGIRLHGKLKPQVEIKDVALVLVGLLGAQGANYSAIEFMGSALEHISIAERMTLCNMMVESGAKFSIMPSDAMTRTFLQQHAFCQPMTEYSADEDAQYERIIDLHLDTISPMLAKPHCVDLVAPLTQCEGTPIHMAIIGTCTNGRIEDLRNALEAMQDLPVAPEVQLLIIPASRQIYIQASEEGILAKLAAKGAVILPPGCGPCCGSSAGIPRDNWNVISTANRNFIGRMGNVKANIYLASPRSVALAAVHGYICSPCKHSEATDLS